MGTKKQSPIDIPITMGIRQDFEAALAPPGALLDATNMQFDKAGRLERREPFDVIATTALSKTNTYTGPARRFATGALGEQLVFADENAFVYFPAKDKLAEAGRRSQVSTLRATLQDASYIGADPAGTVLFADCGYASPWLVTAYTQRDASGTYSVFADIIDRTTGARAWTAETLATGTATTTVQPRVMITDTNIAWVFWAITSGVATTSIVYERIDLSGSTIANPSGGTALVTDAKRTANGPIFDVVPTTGGFVIAYVHDNGAGANWTKVKRYTTAATPVQLGTTYDWLADPGAATWSSTVLALRGASSAAERIMAMGWSPALGTLQALQIDFDLTNPFVSNFANALLAGTEVRQMALQRLSATITLFAYSEAASRKADDSRGHLWYGTITYNALGPSFLKPTNAVLSGYTLGSRFYFDPTNAYVYSFARFNDPNGPALYESAQSHFLLLDWGNLSTVDRPTPQGYVASGRVPWFASNAYTGIGGIADLGTGRFAFVAPINVGASPLNGQQIQITTWQSVAQDRFLSTLANGGLIVGGATPLQYDGQRLVELSFYSYPTVGTASLAQNTTGGFIVPGIYGYRFVWEWVDSLGNRHQSPASPAVTVTVPAGTTTNIVTWSVLGTSCTRKQISRNASAGNIANDQQAPVRLVMYRTTVGGSNFTRHPISALNVTADSSYITLVDSMSDAGAGAGPTTYQTLASGEPLYDGAGGKGQLFSTAPPCTLQPFVHLRRLWGVDQERQDRIWCSKTFEDLESPGYNPALQITVPGCGRIKGIAGQDGKLYALATEGIYLASYGDGPTNTGQGIFPEPQLITKTANCTEPRSVCVGQEGIYFAGVSRWGTTIYQIRRGDGSPVDIGERVRGLLEQCPVVRGAQDRFDEDRCEFLCVDSDTAPTTAVLLYYHYDLLDERGIGQWTVARYGSTNYGNGLALHALGLWDNDTVVSLANGSNQIAVQDPSGAETFDATWQTADIRPFGIAGYGSLDALTTLTSGNVVANIIISASYDSGGTFLDTVRWTTGTEVTLGMNQRRWEQATKKLPYGSARYRFADGDLFDPSTGQSVTWHGLSIEITPEGGNLRLPAGQEG